MSPHDVIYLMRCRIPSCWENTATAQCCHPPTLGWCSKAYKSPSAFFQSTNGFYGHQIKGVSKPGFLCCFWSDGSFLWEGPFSPRWSRTRFHPGSAASSQRLSQTFLIGPIRLLKAERPDDPMLLLLE